jgi:tetratricopeptide (TPR) repeat protein
MNSRVLRLSALPVLRVIRLAVFLLAYACAVLFAQFAAEDEVRLRRDEPLRFKDSVLRQGKTGETYKVMRYDRAAGRVYLLAFGSDGKPFALHCADSALEPAPKDAWVLVREGLNAMQQGDLAGARARFVRASTGENVDRMAMNLALHCETLRKTAEDLGTARKVMQKALADVAILVRNAQVADRTSLIPGDTSNQVRAEEIRTKAAALREKSETAVAAAMDALATAIKSARDYSKSLIESGSLSVGLQMWDAVTSFARKQLPPERQSAEPDVANRAELTRRINTASDALVRARIQFDAKKLLGAMGAVSNGLESEPGRGDLKQFRAVVEASIERARARVQLARSLSDQHRREEALAELAKAEAICADDEEACVLGKELRATPQKLPGGS